MFYLLRRVRWHILVTADGTIAGTIPVAVTGPNPTIYGNSDCSGYDLARTIKTINDDSDLGMLDPKGECSGMPQWRVSEPYISLWLEDEPLGYQPALGPRISFALAFKQREAVAGYNPNVFSTGPKWNFAWLSFVTRDTYTDKTVYFPGGGSRLFHDATDYLTHTRLTGETNTGFNLSYPDGSTNVYGLIVTNSSGEFLKAFMTESGNAAGQKTRFLYDSYTPGSDPTIRLRFVVDGDGRTNTIYYVSTNAYSTNLISQVVDAFGRTNALAYDNQGRLTNLTDVINLSSALTYNSSNWVSALTTPYGTTSFTFTDTTGTNVVPDGRSVFVTSPDGSHELFLNRDSAPGIASSYGTNEIPNTSPFANTFETNQFNLRNSFHWGPRQYEGLSATNIASFTTNDYRKARLQHWLVGAALSMRREPSPDSLGNVEGQKTWYDYDGKMDNHSVGTQSAPLFVGSVLPDGTTQFQRSDRNLIGNAVTAIETFSNAGATALRTNSFSYAANAIDRLRATNVLGIQVSSNAYNAYHQITTSFNALNEKTVLTYNTNQQLTSVKWPSGLVTTNIYGADGFVAQTIVTGIATNSFTYSNDLRFTETDARGLTTTNTWDNLQRLRRRDYPDGTFITNTWDKLDLVRTVDRMGFPATFGYDALRRRVAETNALGYYTLKDYCSCGALNSVRDASGNYTYYFYDNAGRETNTVFADGYSVTNTFNLLGQLTNVIDSAGTSVTNWFNNQGLQVASSNAFGRVESVVYDVLNRATNVIDANGVSVSATFDTLNRPLTQSYPDSGVEKYGYTLNFAAATSYTNQLGSNIVNYAYDAMGRKTNEVYPGITTNKFTYSGAGDELTLTDGKNQTTTLHYDAFGRPTNKVDAASNEIFHFTYDLNNRLTNLWTPAKGSITYRFDSVGNLTNVIYPVSSNIVMQYDSLNRMTNRTDAVGTTKYSYTVASLLASEDGPWANDTVSYNYTNRLRAGMTILTPSSSLLTSYSYDLMKRLTNVTSPAGAFGYLYPASQPSRLVARLSLPNSAFITNSYDSMARLLSTKLLTSNSQLLNAHAYGYNLAGQRTALTNTAGDYRSYTFDNAGQLKTALGYEADATSRLNEQMGYAYDPAGNLNQRTNNALVQTFNVNSLNELNTVTRSGTLTVAGNTTTAATNVTVNALTATRYADKTFAKEGFPLVDGTTNFTAIAANSFGLQVTNVITANLAATNVFVYDLNGNMLTNGMEVLEYDDENRLVTNYVAAAWKSEFVYDGDNRRRIQRDYGWSGSAWVKTNEVRLVYDGNVIIQHRDANNVPTLTLTRGLDLSGSLQGAGGIGGLLAMTEASGTSSYYHGDGGGNVTALINANQLVVGKYSYDSFGRTLSISGPKAPLSPYRFSSKPQHDPSGHYDYLYRWYIPELQRFANADPNQEADGPNRFTFVHNDSINAIDDFGLGVIYIKKADGSTYLEITPTQPRQLTPAEKIRDLVLPNPKETIRQVDQAFATAANPNLDWTDRASGASMGVGVAILGVLEFVPGAGAETKPLKKECEVALKAIPQFAKSSVDDVVAQALKRGLNLGEHAGERLLGREGEVTMKMIETTLQKGKKYYDPLNKSYVSVLEKGMASGKDIAVAVDAVSGEIRTIMTNAKIVRPRFQPVP